MIKGPTSPLTPLSVLSYNVLLPNSHDGWWTYKFYLPPVEDPAVASWEYRRQLLQERINQAGPSIVCFQEVSPTTFEEDFAFMSDLGYDGVELFKKGRFRPATFWKTETCELAAPAVHKDRTLLTAFQWKNGDHTSTSPSTWYVLNCHLQAGKQAPRRVRQINEGVRAVVTLARKLNEPDPTDVPLIVCGDFNGGSECGAVRYLEDGKVDETFFEDGAPVTSSEKVLPLKRPMYDALATGREEGVEPPPTMVVSELISLMVAPRQSTNGEAATAWEDPDLSDDMRERLEDVFAKFARGQTKDGTTPAMRVSDVEEWLTLINGQVGRGDEFRAAARQMGWMPPEDDADARITELPADSVLTVDGFVAVYEAELRAGKFWGIAHDMAVLGHPLPVTRLFTARYDRMYASSLVHTTAVMDFVATQPCPNAQEPSDHLPVAASFCVQGQ